MILAFVIVVALGYILWLSIYRIIFHPLAGFPGPKLAALTKWYEFYFDIAVGDGGQFMWQLKRMHEIYGPIVRINPDEIHIEDPDFYKMVYANNPTYRDKYPPAAHMSGAPLGTFGTVNHEVHRKRRAANSTFFSTKAINESEPLLQQQVQFLLDKFLDAFEYNDVLDLRVVFLAFSADTVHQYALGESFCLQDDPQKAKEWHETIRALAGLTPLVKQFPWVIDLGKMLPIRLVHFFLPSLARILQLHTNSAERFLTSESQGSMANTFQSQPSTLLHCIFSSSLPLFEKSAQRMAQEVFVTVSAGSETTARTLSLMMYCLCDNPRVLKKLQAEVDKAIKEPDKLPTLKTVLQLPYLLAVIKETLRIGALITSRGPLLAPDPLVYKQWVIPPQTPISLTMRDTLLHPEIYPDPMTFNVNRWLEHSVNDEYFIPFGSGTRMCQGMKFAYAAMSLAAAMIVRRFEFKLFETIFERDVEIVRDCFVGETDPRSKGIRVSVVGIRA